MIESTQPFSSQALKPLTSLPEVTQNARFFMGNLPLLLKDSKRVLGEGSTKSVKSITASTFTLSYSCAKIAWKDVAVAKYKTSNNKFSKPYEFLTEFCVLKQISEQSNYARYTPKIYFIGYINSHIALITKRMSGGDACHWLPSAFILQRLKAIGGVGKGVVNLLHRQGIVHNDIAMRNMLIERCTKYLSVDDLNPYESLARPIFCQMGEKIIPQNVIGTPGIKARLSELNIKRVKVYDDRKIKGMISDFGCCTFKNLKINPLQFIYTPFDCQAPERRFAILRHHSALRDYLESTTMDLKEEVSLRLYQQVLRKAKKVDRYTTPKSDAFSFGLLICDALLRPNINTDLSLRNESYINMIKDKVFIQFQGFMNYLSHNEPLSAISELDYNNLSLIDQELADLAFDLLKNDAQTRMSIDQAIGILKEIKNKFTDKSFFHLNLTQNIPSILEHPSFSYSSSCNKDDDYAYDDTI